jgi:enoyl-CoA hydratase
MLNRTQDGGVATITLNQAARGNALSAAMVEALLTAVQDTTNNPDVHTLVLRGEGKHFCTGLDLTDLDTTTDGDLLHRLVRIETLLSAVWHAPLRTVAVAQGRTFGAGADLFAACEQRLALAGSRFRFPGAQFGIVLGTRRLAVQVGEARARAWVIHGMELDAAAACEAGLATGRDEPRLASPLVEAHTAAAVRAATRADHRDADLATLVRSAAAPGLKARVLAYRQGQLAQRAQGGEP